MSYSYKLSLDLITVNEEDFSDRSRHIFTVSETSSQVSHISFAFSGTTNREVAISQYSTIDYIIIKNASDSTEDVIYHFTTVDGASEESVQVPVGSFIVLNGYVIDPGGTSYVDSGVSGSGTVEIIVIGTH